MIPCPTCRRMQCVCGVGDTSKIDVSNATQKASSVQIAGEHYRNFEVQPAEFVEKNELSYLEASVVYRMCRWRSKGTPLEDLKKAIHEIELLIEIHSVE